MDRLLRETGSLPAGFLNLTITLGGIGVWMLVDGGNLDQPRSLGAWLCALALVNAALFIWSRSLPERGTPEPLPALLGGSYVLFTIILVAVGISLILGVPDVMPWPVDRDVSVVFGWIFFGDAWYFAYAVARPDWRYARAQLWSFLGYDVVLFVPLLLASTDTPAAAPYERHRLPVDPRVQRRLGDLLPGSQPPHSRLEHRRPPARAGLSGHQAGASPAGFTSSRYRCTY